VRIFERLLWSSRLIVIVPVIASLLIAIVMVYLSTVDGWYVLAEVRHYVDPSMSAAQRSQLHASTIAHVAATIDGYLFATILIIFSLGLYELFIGRIEAIEHSEVARRLLLIHSIDDLKERLAKVVFLILVVRYFEFALEENVAQSPLELLYLAIGIALIALSLYLTAARRPA
jgi:uncharacterized membrane protein YqhA